MSNIIGVFSTLIILQAAFSLVFSLSGCSINNLSKPHINTSLGDYSDVLSDTEAVLLISDNQITEERNKPILENSSELARDSIAGRSVYRQGVGSALSPIILQHILKDYKGKLVIHVGDALNNSCISEYELFEKIMGESSWYLAPGNHDGYYMGLTSPIKEKDSLSIGILNEPSGWCQICRPYYSYIQINSQSCRQLIESNKEHKYILDKRNFVKKYLKSIGLSSYENVGSYDASIDNNNETKRIHLNKAEWFISNEKERTPWESFIVQQLNVYSNTKTKSFAIIILDTASYSTKPNILRYAGAADTAEINDRQAKIVSSWLDDLRNQNVSVVLIGHHPLDDFTQKSIEIIKKWYNQDLFKVYISGDVHDGYNVAHRKILNKKETLLKEVNIGSTIDAPIEFMKFSLANNSNFIFQRYFMTPFDNKIQKKYGYPKNGTIDPIWNECECNYGKYNSARGKQIYLGAQSDMINGIMKSRLIINSRIRFTFTKLRRYSEMFNIYHEIFTRSNLKNKNKILNLINEATSLIDNQIKNGNTIGSEILLIQLSCYLDGKKCYKTSDDNWKIIELGLKSLQETALFIDETPELRRLKNYMLCAALFSSEYDY